MTWLTLAMKNWQLILIGLLIVCMAGLTMRVQVVTAQRNEAIANLDSYKTQAKLIADNSKRLSDASIKEINDGIPILVAAAKTSAVENFKRRFPSSSIGCGIGSLRLPNMPSGSGGAETSGSASADGTHEQEPLAIRDTIEQCAVDAGMLELWKNWAIRNELPVQ